MRTLIRAVVLLALLALMFSGVIDQFIDFMGGHFSRIAARWFVFFLCVEGVNSLVDRALRRWLPDQMPVEQPVA